MAEATEINLEKEKHILVVDENGVVTQNDQGMWLVMDSTTQNIFYITPTVEVLNFFEIADEQQDIHIQSDEVPAALASSSTDELVDIRCPWSSRDILKLIHLYQKYRERFKKTTVKNNKVWQWIATDMKTHNALQCKNKFKYLKAKYVEKKDNMSNRKTGAKAIRFSYFTEFDEMFGKDENIQPEAIASSSRGEGNILSPENKNEDESAVSSAVSNPKKRKKSVLEKQLAKYDENIREREQAKEKRHTEILQRQDQALTIFSKIADSFQNWVDK